MHGFTDKQNRFIDGLKDLFIKMNRLDGYMDKIY